MQVAPWLTGMALWGVKAQIIRETAPPSLAHSEGGLLGEAHGGGDGASII
jgi:hypothetical protein